MLRLPLYALLVQSALAQRAIHWVIRVSSLEDTLKFTTDFLGMTLLRHEENADACELTCNGAYNTSWSKTMVGYGPEDANYALELTYNYGVDRYSVGEGLQRFVLHLPNRDERLAKAAEAGFRVVHEVDGGLVTGPDGYQFEIRELDKDTSEAVPWQPSPSGFGHIVLRAADPTALAEW